jgi:hypothetical protein
VGRVPCHPLLTLVRRCLVSFPPFILSSCTCTPYPPRKQLLTAVVWASPCPPPGVPPLSWSSPFPFVSVSLPVGCHYRRYRSTCHPPHGQLLMGLGVGGVSFVALGGAGPVSVIWCGVDAGRGVSVFVVGPFLVVVGPWCSFSSSSVGGPLVCPPSSLSLSHPVFTPRAVAHGSGGGCWLSSVLWGSGMGGRLLSFPCCHSPVVVPTSFCIGTRCW